MEFVEGTILESRYELTKQLGSGASGTVFLAEDKDLGRKVAIKVLNLAPTEDSTALKRFEREAKILNSLLHPNIVRVYRYGLIAERTPFLVMEYAEGESLRQRLDRVEQLNCHDAVSIAQQLASALEYAHSAGVVHRDLKPENLIITADAVKLLDFGLCKLAVSESQGRTLTQTGSVLGTAFYMSPEQCMGKDADERSDIYSFACVLFEMITGDIPFRGDNHSAIMLKQLSDPFPDILALAPSSGLPQELQALLNKCGQKRKEDRYQNFAELQQELAKVAALNNKRLFNRKEAERRKNSPLNKVPTISPKLIRNSLIAVSIAAASVGAFLICTESGNFLLLSQIQQNMSADDSIKSLCELVSGFVSSGNKEAAVRVVDSSLKSARFRSWAGIDREHLIEKYIEIFKDDKFRSERMDLKIALLGELLDSVQSGLLGKKSRSKNKDASLQEEIERLNTLSSELLHTRHERPEWAKIARALDSKWEMIPNNSSKNLLWLWVLRCEAWRQKSDPVPDAKDLGKFYAYAASIAILADNFDILKQLVQTGTEHSVKYGAYNRATTLHTYLGDYYLNKGQVELAKEELAEAKQLSEGHGLSGAEQGGLDRLEEGCRLGIPLPKHRVPKIKKAMPVIYQEVLQQSGQ